MAAPSSSFVRRATRAVIVVLIWLGLTLGGASAHQALWSGRVRESLKPAGSLLHVAMSPGLVAGRLVLGYWPVRGRIKPLMASGGAAAFWIACAGLTLAARSRLVRRPADAVPGPLAKGAPRAVDGASDGTPGSGDGRVTATAAKAGDVAGEPARIDLSRRRVLVDGVLAAGCAGAIGPVVAATLVEPWRLQVRHYTVPIRDLPVALEGVRLVQISDTHLGARIPSTFIAQAVRRAIELAPDLFLLTGDYILGGEKWISGAAELFEPLMKEKVPVLGVLGNHDWYWNGPRMSEELGRLGVTMLDNRRLFLNKGMRNLTDSPRHAGLCLAGVGDLLTDTVDVDAVLGGVPDDLPRLLLSHNPDVAELASLRGRRLDLMFCGHTHGGQVRLPLVGAPIVPSAFGQKYAGGLVEGPVSRVVVSRGVGMSGLPLRFNVPPEVVEVMLIRG